MPLDRQITISRCHQQAMKLESTTNAVDVHRALSLIEDDIFRTPVIKSIRLTKFLSRCLTIDRTIQVFVKCVILQMSGSFKYRGALHSVLHLSDEQLRKGVVTYSTGKSFVRTFQCVLG